MFNIYFEPEAPNKGLCLRCTRNRITNRITSDFRRRGLQIPLSEKSQGGEVINDSKHFCRDTCVRKVTSEPPPGQGLRNHK